VAILCSAMALRGREMTLMLMLSSAGAGAGARRLAFAGPCSAPAVRTAQVLRPTGAAGALRLVATPPASRRRQTSAPDTSAKAQVTPAQGGQLRSINALTLCTHDMRKACAFYSKLGLKQTFGGPNSEFTTFSANAPVTQVMRALAHRQTDRQPHTHTHTHTHTRIHTYAP